ncbi:MAG TPA: haloalkane dehalogenase [Acidimicrobiales bacterium]|nr:haloalkane dehalogenase [Acidimicrobiales bacterium]
MDILRTPDEQFDDLPGYDFTPRYVEVPVDADGEGFDPGATLRVHYLDEGPADGPVVLLLHGEPTWSYLYRHMIPVLTGAGLRCIVPDLVGFGRSDKPAAQADHTYARQVAWMRAALFDVLDLADITFFGQDWGSLVGLRLVAEHPDRFTRVAIGNGGLPTGDGRMSKAFMDWQNFASTTEHFPVGAIINGGSTSDLDEAIVAAYNAPFPDDSYKAAARVYPSLVPVAEDNPAVPANRAAWAALGEFTKPFLTAFSDEDPITKGGFRILQSHIPGAQNQPHVTIEGGGHFLQEDRGPELAQVIIDFAAAS